MKQKSGPGKPSAEQVVKDIRRQTRRHYSAEEKIRIVLEGLRGEHDASGPASSEPAGIVPLGARSPASSDRGKLRVFISYSREDLESARRGA
jgi:transposase